MGINDVAFIPNFVKIDQLIQKLKEEYRDEQHGDTSPFTSLTERKRLKNIAAA
jgi:hypothetical protein